MTYQETVKYLYDQLPAFQHVGKNALRPSLRNIQALCGYLDNPQLKFKSIHVAGTNGKGSSSHMLASILQEAGYKTGLYTSPHLKDFRERFRINGQLVTESEIKTFVEKHKKIIESIKPSFFEVTVAMAFDLFAKKEVEIAVIETGLGGRLDSTNIINPILSLITNIGLDHTDVLGNTLEEIAYEKAGIIKPGIPVVISERQTETTKVFDAMALKQNCSIYYANDFFKISEMSQSELATKYLVNDKSVNEQIELHLDLHGNYQKHNLLGVLKVVKVLTNRNAITISIDDLRKGLAKVVKNTSLKGRWQRLSIKPLIIADTGHNGHAFSYLKTYTSSINPQDCHFVLGFSKDKYLEETLGILPKESQYYFSEFNSFRSLKVSDLTEYASIFNIINFNVFSNVNDALATAKKNAKQGDFIYIGGSTYLVAELDNL